MVIGCSWRARTLAEPTAERSHYTVVALALVRDFPGLLACLAVGELGERPRRACLLEQAKLLCAAAAVRW